MRMPFSAPRPLATSTAVGVARPRAQGQATTKTATVHCKPVVQSPPARPQTSSVAAATASTAGTNRATTRSASRPTSVFDSWARRTSSITWANADLAAGRSTSAVSEPWRLIVPAKTSSPGCLSTGIDSPVNQDWSTLDAPETIFASRGTFSPGRMRIVSPGGTAPTATRCVWPSRKTVASGGERSSSLRMACEARPRALVSRNLPRLMKVRIMAASAKYMSPIERSCQLSVVGCQLGRGNRQLTRPSCGWCPTDNCPHAGQIRRPGPQGDERVHVGRRTAQPAPSPGQIGPAHVELQGRGQNELPGDVARMSATRPSTSATRSAPKERRRQEAPPPTGRLPRLAIKQAYAGFFAGQQNAGRVALAADRGHKLLPVVS